VFGRRRSFHRRTPRCSIARRRLQGKALGSLERMPDAQCPRAFPPEYVQPVLIRQSLFRTGQTRCGAGAGNSVVDLVMRANAHAACVVGLLLMNTVAAADRPVYCDTERWRSLIAEAGTRFEIPQVWLHAVIRAESAGCELIDGHPITSAAGAMGLMQLMPATWNEYRERLTLGNDPYNRETTFWRAPRTCVNSTIAMAHRICSRLITRVPSVTKLTDWEKVHCRRRRSTISTV